MWLWAKGSTGKIDAKMHKRVLARLDALDASTRPEDMNIPGFDFHGSKVSTRRATPFTSTARGASRSSSMDRTPPRSIWNNTIDGRGPAYAQHRPASEPRSAPTHPGFLLADTPATGKSKAEIARLLGISRQQLYTILDGAGPRVALPWQ